MPIAKLRAIWRNIYDSLWFIPALFTLAAIVVAALLLRADPLLPEGFERRRLGWLFSGGSEGARGVLAAIAGSIITITGSMLPPRRHEALRAQLARVRLIALEKLTLDLDRAGVEEAVAAAERRLGAASNRMERTATRSG